MRYVLGKERNQLELISLDGLVSEDSFVRGIDKLIEESDTSYFSKSAAKETGRPPFNPKDMLKLYVYGFENGVYSSRKLDRECKRNIELMWLLKGLAPDDKTICNFRRDNSENITKFFQEFCKTLAKAGYIEGKIVSIDGTKIRANNSKRSNFSAKKLERHIEYIDNKITEYLTEVDKNDRIAELEERKAKYESFKNRIKSGEVTEVSTTDPDSRLMKQGNNGVDVSYNVQTAVDSKYKLITGVFVTNEPNDQGQLHKVAGTVKDNLELKSMTVLGDKGYYDTEDFKNCHENNIVTIVARPNDDGYKDIDFKRSDFKYDKENDCYYCPAEKTLKFSVEEKNGHRKYRNPKDCKNCPQKSQCTKSAYRTVSRHKHAGHAEQNDVAFKENFELYTLRQQLSEHPFGTVKRTMGIRQFLTRGLINVTAEAALIFLCYNLKRLRNIHGNDSKKTGNPLCLHAFLSFSLLFIFYLLYRKFLSLF